MKLMLPNNQVTAVILGTMQDGGLPHIGCECIRCTASRKHSTQKLTACLAIVDTRGEKTATSTSLSTSVFLIDATPDIKHQLHLLADVLGEHPTRPARLRQPDGLFLTHAHLGHIGGLPQLGPEAMAVEQLPVYASSALCDLLRETQLWSPMMARIDLRPFPADQPMQLGDDLWITAVSVPHRDEWDVGTYAFHIQGPTHSLLYLPDIDNWAEWPDAGSTLNNVDYALVDATFYSTEELGGRDPVAHPLVEDTLRRFANIQGQLLLTHFNHTNPVLTDGTAAQKTVLATDVEIARLGKMIRL